MTSCCLPLCLVLQSSSCYFAGYWCVQLRFKTFSFLVKERAAPCVICHGPEAFRQQGSCLRAAPPRVVCLPGVFSAACVRECVCVCGLIHLQVQLPSTDVYGVSQLFCLVSGLECSLFSTVTFVFASCPVWMREKQNQNLPIFCRFRQQNDKYLLWTSGLSDFIDNLTSLWFLH